jgi:hypothetical protein
MWQPQGNEGDALQIAINARQKNRVVATMGVKKLSLVLVSCRQQRETERAYVQCPLLGLEVVRRADRAPRVHLHSHPILLILFRQALGVVDLIYMHLIWFPKTTLTADS